jgi:phage protein U
MLALGEFRFSLKTIPFDQIKEVSSYRWEEQRLFGKGSQLQYTGYDAPQVTISGVSFLQGNKSLELIQKLKEEAKKGKPMLLVDSYGKVHGKWVLTEIEVTAQRRTLYIVVGNRHIGIRLTKGNEWCEFGGG